VSFSDEELPADFTRIVSQAIVAFQMHIEVSLFREPIAAKVARIGLNPQMFANVNLKPRFLRVADPADRALEGLHILMI
jgi:hypothetical protein